MSENTTEIYKGVIEYILYLRDRNSEKDWGHIWGWTTIFSYCRWNREKSNLEKYSKYLEKGYCTEDDFLLCIRTWYFGGFHRELLEKYREKYSNNFLYNFIYALSFSREDELIYYFRFSESIDATGLKHLLLTYKQEPNYLFVNIALGSYYQQNQQYKLAYNFYIQALKQDNNNPWVLAKISILYTCLGQEHDMLNAYKSISIVTEALPKAPWVYGWKAEIANKVGKYIDSLKAINQYENLTECKHRTFDPFLRKAEAYIGVGDFKKARAELNKESQYYFGEGYRFVYNQLNTQLQALGY